jgi:PAS domain S-box-containing protein
MQEQAIDHSDVSTLPTKELQALVHELRVHQIELEIQNDELKRVQLELEASRDEFQDLYDFAPVGYFTLTHKGLIIQANLAGASLIGMPHPQLINRGFGRFVVPESLDEWDQHISAVLKQEERQACDLRVKRQDGSSFYAHVESVRMAVAEQSEINGSAYVVRLALSDISERKKMEDQLQAACDDLESKVRERTKELTAANRCLVDEMNEGKRAKADLRQSEESIRAIFEMARDGVFTKDLSLRYTLVNPYMKRLLGLPASLIRGKTDRELYGAAAGQYLEALDSRVLRGESIETEHTREIQGNTITFLETRTPVYDQKGAIIGLCGISRDITDRRVATGNIISGETEYPSPIMRKTLSDAGLVAPTDCTVFLTGESGSGKDYLARYIHRHSRRSGGPFYVINCAAIPSELAESELFGHEMGAFTGAHRRKRGYLELAEGGTVLLNELMELALHLQAKLLTFLDTRSITRVGGGKPITVDIRLIAATNGDIERAVREGAFRSDLFFRLGVVTIMAPPLRKRLEDLPALVEHILSRISEHLGLSPVPRLSSRIVEKLARYEWPGNVRELQNTLEKALILTRGDPKIMNDPETWNLGSPVYYPSHKVQENLCYNERIKDLKCALIEDALRRMGGNKVAAARLLGMSRDAFYRQIRTLNLDV